MAKEFEKTRELGENQGSIVSWKSREEAQYFKKDVINSLEFHKRSSKRRTEKSPLALVA